MQANDIDLDVLINRLGKEVPGIRAVRVFRRKRNLPLEEREEYRNSFTVHVYDGEKLMCEVRSGAHTELASHDRRLRPFAETDIWERFMDCYVGVIRDNLMY